MRTKTNRTDGQPVVLVEKSRTSKRLPWLLGGLVGGVLLGRSLWASKKPPVFRVTGEHPGTALITGASSGIGAAFARRLAVERYHLILVARREDRLNALAARLRQQHRVDVEVLVADLANAADVERVAQRIGACETLSMLVNNAGFGTNGHFAESDIEQQVRMIQVHVVATTRLSRAALPGMKERQRGAIVNVSSAAAWVPVPDMVTYAATKSHLNTFSLGLSAELEGTGVQVQALCPGFTHTEFHDTPNFQSFDRAIFPAWAWMSARQVVAASLQGLEQGNVIVIPDPRYRPMIAALSTPFLSTPLWNVAVSVYRHLVSNRPTPSDGLRQSPEAGRKNHADPPLGEAQNSRNASKG